MRLVRALVVPRLYALTPTHAHWANEDLSNLCWPLGPHEWVH